MLSQDIKAQITSNFTFSRWLKTKKTFYKCSYTPVYNIMAKTDLAFFFQKNL